MKFTLNSFQTDTSYIGLEQDKDGIIKVGAYSKMGDRLYPIREMVYNPKDMEKAINTFNRYKRCISH